MVIEPLETRVFLSATADDTTAPQVDSVYVSGTAWTSRFKTFLQSGAQGSAAAGFRIGGSTQADELPWTNLNRVSIRFTEHVNVALHDLVVRGGDVPVYAFAATSPFTYDPQTFTATWTLATAGVRDDKLLLELSAVPDRAGVADAAGNALDGEWANPASPAVSADAYPSGNGSPGGDFVFRTHVLGGDANRNGSVYASDVTLVRGAQGYATGSSRYSIFKDVDGSGSITATDVSLARARQGTTMPGYDPVALATVHVNAGGAATADAFGRPFEADAGFAGGSASAAAYDVAGTADDALYGAYRSGSSFTFTRRVANGNYALLLGFAEPDPAAAAGTRTFDVTAEGQLALDDFDVFRAAGAARTAVAASADVRVSDGRLDVAFTGVSGAAAIVSSLVLIPTDVPAVALPYDPANFSPDAKRVTAASHLRMVGQGVVMYANEHRGKFPADLQSVFPYLDDHARFTSPRTDTRLARGEMSVLERLAWLRTTDDFVYVGAGLTHTAGAGAVVAYENPARVAGGLNVLFADGHVSYYDRDAAARFITLPPTEPPAPPAQPILAGDAPAVESARRMRVIGQAMFTHSNEHRGRFPVLLGDLVRGQHVPAATFVNPRGPTAPPPPADWTWEQQAAWVDASTDYVYLTPNASNSMPPTRVLLHENPAGMKGGLTLLFADSHTEFRETRWALETVRRSKLGSP